MHLTIDCGIVKVTSFYQGIAFEIGGGSKQINSLDTYTQAHADSEIHSYYKMNFGNMIYLIYFC